MIYQDIPRKRTFWDELWPTRSPDGHKWSRKWRTKIECITSVSALRGPPPTRRRALVTDSLHPPLLHDWRDETPRHAIFYCGEHRTTLEQNQSPSLAQFRYSRASVAVPLEPNLSSSAPAPRGTTSTGRNFHQTWKTTVATPEQYLPYALVSNLYVEIFVPCSLACLEAQPDEGRRAPRHRHATNLSGV